MKAKAKVYKGIEFISVSELPANQQLLLQHAQKPERIKIMLDGKILENCIQYREYNHWYSTVYNQSVALQPAKSAPEEAIPAKIVLQKA
jgi:hypothetical protein